MKRVIVVSIVVLVMLLAGGMVFAGGQKDAGGQTDQGSITIAYTGYPGGLSPFWAQMTAYLKADAKKMGVNLLDMSPADANAMVQKDAVDNAINRGVDGIILGAIDNRAFDDSLARAAEKGIPVVAVDTAVDHPQVKALVQTDNLASARVMGQYIVDTTEKGTVIILGGTLGHQTGDARRDGAKQVLEANGYKVVFRACNWDAGTALETATNELASNDNVVAVFGVWDSGALAGYAAVKQRGLTDKVKVYGFDGSPDAIKSIQNGELTADLKQDNEKMADVSLKNIVALAKGGEAPVSKMLIDGIVIDKNNADEYSK